MEIEWRDCSEFPGYQVSNTGLVKSLKRGHVGRIRYQATDYHGYKRIVMAGIDIKRKNVSVHRLVAREFVDNPHNNQVVNHIDGNKSNNLYSNLEWCTPGQNQSHAYRIGLRGPMPKHRAKINQDIVNYIRSSGKGTTELMSEIGLCRSTINRIKKFVTWR